MTKRKVYKHTKKNRNPEWERAVYLIHITRSHWSCFVTKYLQIHMRRGLGDQRLETGREDRYPGVWIAFLISGTKRLMPRVKGGKAYCSSQFLEASVHSQTFKVFETEAVSCLLMLIPFLTGVGGLNFHRSILMPTQRPIQLSQSLILSSSKWSASWSGAWKLSSGRGCILFSSLFYLTQDRNVMAGATEAMLSSENDIKLEEQMGSFI